jgi:hypothetical protein
MGVDTDTDVDVDVLRAAGQHVTAGGWVQWQWADRQCYVARVIVRRRGVVVVMAALDGRAVESCL